MKVNCIKCAAEIPAANMKLEQMVATCPACQTVFTIEDQFWAGRPASVPQRLEVVRPANVQQAEVDGRLIFRWHWFDWKALVMTGVTFFWVSTLFSLTDVFSSDTAEPGLLGSFPLYFCPHFWVSLFLIYCTLASYINQTLIVVDKKQLRVQHGPLPWIGNLRLPAAHITQLYTKYNYSEYRRGNNYYEVYVIVMRSNHYKLLSHLDEPEYAFFVEQEIERFLGIEDQPVKWDVGLR